MTLMEALKAGAVFHYAPVSGGLLLMLNGERLTDVPYTMQEFVRMQWDGILEKIGDMGQGHSILRGHPSVKLSSKVDFYKLK